MMNSRENHGLKWVSKTFGLEPAWTAEPDLEAAKQRVVDALAITEGAIDISFFTQGGFNKIYNIFISGSSEKLIFRVALPVDPGYKTLSEVATLQWMRQNTNLPVPKVVASDTSRDNSVGFEWILMNKLPGNPLADVWKLVSYQAKEALVKRFAEFSSVLFRKQLSGIGNIYSASAPKVDRIVSAAFFWGNHLRQDVNRGPFSSSKDWVEARLALSEYDCRETLSKYLGKSDVDSDEEADLEDGQRTLEIVNKLRPLVSKILPAGDGQEVEPSILFHDDLNNHNVLVDESGALTGVVDWECVSAIPLWKACNYPLFLESKPRDKKPDQTRYRREADGELTQLFWEHMMEHECTSLRRVYFDEIARLEPGWMEIYRKSTMKRDPDLAVQICDGEFVAQHISDWAGEAIAGGSNIRSLKDRIDEVW